VIAGIHLVPLSLESGEGLPELSLLDRLSAAIARALGVSVRVETEPVFVDGQHDERRNQVWSTAVLAELDRREKRPKTVVLGVTGLDLYVPVLTFVFGEAQLGGTCAVVSAHRLRNEYYGVPGDEAVLVERLLKETLHEFGHTQGLRHCAEWRCVMSSAHAVERIDLRAAAYCRDCAVQFSGR